MDALKHLVCPISPTLLPDASKRDIQKKDALLDEAATAHAKRTETVDDAIKVFAKGKHVRTEFAPGHAMHGQIVFFEDGEHVRTEYAPGHWRHGINRLAAATHNLQKQNERNRLILLAAVPFHRKCFDELQAANQQVAAMQQLAVVHEASAVEPQLTPETADMLFMLANSEAMNCDVEASFGTPRTVNTQAELLAMNTDELKELSEKEALVMEDFGLVLQSLSALDIFLTTEFAKLQNDAEAV